MDNPAIIVPDLRYPVGSDTVWTATEPGFYAMLAPASEIRTVPTASVSGLGTLVCLLAIIWD